MWSIAPRTRHGGRARTDVVHNTLFPNFSGSRAPLHFTGTRWQLEEETLRLDVFDWDVGGRLTDDLIGVAEVGARRQY